MGDIFGRASECPETGERRRPSFSGEKCEKDYFLKTGS